MNTARQPTPSLLRPSSGRAKPSARPAKRGPAFRRSDVARFRPTAGEPNTVEIHAEASLWERCAIPTGMLVFWTWFVGANWNHLSQLLS
jgi:hypothetical protein